MNVLVLNSGSSSIKFSLFATEKHDPTLLLDGEMSGIGTPQATLALTQGSEPEQKRTLPGTDYLSTAMAAIFNALQTANAGSVDAVGYRVVHPGAEIQDHTLITEEILHKLEAASAFAPLHDPEAVTLIRETQKHFPGVPHFACFDTVFHRTMPAEASTYAIPQKYRDLGVKRYGFHGLSCESVVRQMHERGPLPARMVIAHLGSGCSVTALRDGESIDTTMGLTPTGGIVMGTRPGDLDPGLLLYLLRQGGADAVEKMLNHEAGMVALTGLPNDMRQVRKAATEGDAAALLALKVFTRSVRKAIGGFAWLLGGLDAIVFTGGIGQHDPATRAEVLTDSEVFTNCALNTTKATDLRPISASDSKTDVFVAPSQEDLVIALHVTHMVGAGS